MIMTRRTFHKFVAATAALVAGGVQAVETVVHRVTSPLYKRRFFVMAMPEEYTGKKVWRMYSFKSTERGETIFGGGTPVGSLLKGVSVIRDGYVWYKVRCQNSNTPSLGVMPVLVGGNTQRFCAHFYALYDGGVVQHESRKDMIFDGIRPRVRLGEELIPQQLLTWDYPIIDPRDYCASEFLTLKV